MRPPYALIYQTLFLFWPPQTTLLISLPGHVTEPGQWNVDRMIHTVFDLFTKPSTPDPSCSLPISRPNREDSKHEKKKVTWWEEPVLLSNPWRQGGWRGTSTWDLSVRERDKPYSVKSMTFWTQWCLLACPNLVWIWGQIAWVRNLIPVDLTTLIQFPCMQNADSNITYLMEYLRKWKEVYSPVKPGI